MQAPDFAFIWKEERQLLAEMAGQTPTGGVIVEIGTAWGGTAAIFHSAVAGKGVTIYTVDICSSEKARENLARTDVRMINASSEEFAARWRKEDGRPIDLLYIDGDHNFSGIYSDFASWVPFSAPGGKIMFHDYDPPERGGVVHLGVQVFLDAIIEKKLLDGARHEYKMLTGVIPRGGMETPSIGDSFKAFKRIGEKAAAVRREVFAGSIREGIDILKGRDIPFNTLQACYCVEHAMNTDYALLDAQSKSFQEFRHWAEFHYTLGSGYGLSSFPEMLGDISEPHDVLSLSRMIAREQIRLNILMEILKTLVPWNP